MKATSKIKSSTVNADSLTQIRDPIIRAAMLRPLGVDQPRPHPIPVRLIWRRNKTSRKLIYIKRRGRKALSTGISAEHIDRIPELLAMVTIQEEAERKAMVASKGTKIQALIAAWIEANVPHQQEST